MTFFQHHFFGSAGRFFSLCKNDQDHTSQDHFCSVIDEFPVWNSEPDQPTMMSWATVLEREKALELLMKISCIDDRSSSFDRRMYGTAAVWVVFSCGNNFPIRVQSVIYNLFRKIDSKYREVFIQFKSFLDSRLCFGWAVPLHHLNTWGVQWVGFLTFSVTNSLLARVMKVIT